MKKTLLILILSVYTWDIIHADVVWNLSDNGTLTISGTEMSNYDVQKAPWYSQRKNIKNVVIEKGVKKHRKLFLLSLFEPCFCKHPELCDEYWGVCFHWLL